MANVYKLGDKTFKSTGDLNSDIAIIKKNFPEVDASALEKAMASGGSFGSDMAADPVPANIRQRYDNYLSRGVTSVQQKRDFDTITKSYPSLLPPKPVVEKEKKSPQTALADKADVKKYLNDIIMADQSRGVLDDVEKFKKGVDTGPWAGDFFDSAIYKTDSNGKEIPPDFWDKIITTFAPEATGKMRQLDTAIMGMGESAQDKGGKALTGVEKPFYFTKVPSRFDNDDPDNNVFGNILEQGRGEYKDYIQSRLKVLKGLGYDEKTIMNLIGEEMQKTQDPNAQLPANPSFLQNVIQGGSPQQGQGKPLDEDTANKFYDQAGGDKKKAMELAIQAGYSI